MSSVCSLKPVGLFINGMTLALHDLAKIRQEHIEQSKIVNIWLYIVSEDWPNKWAIWGEVHVGYADQRLGLSRWVEQEQKGGLLDWKKRSVDMLSYGWACDLWTDKKSSWCKSF